MRLLIALLTAWIGSAPVSAEVVFSDPESAALNMQQFDLSELEASRAERLRVLDRSFGVDNLSAVELLGKYAETDTERQAYARKHVIAAADNLARSQSWALAIYQVSQEQNLVAAILQSNPDIQAALAQLNMAPPPQDWSGFDRGRRAPKPKRTLYVGLECDACVEAYLQEEQQVLAREYLSLDLVFVDTTALDEVSIFNWARSAGIPARLLESKLVNLHVDSDAFRAARNNRRNIPLLVR